MTLKEARLMSGKTQEQAAEEIGVTGGAISQWESGKTHPRFSCLPAVAKCYGVRVDDLLNEY